MRGFNELTRLVSTSIYRDIDMYERKLCIIVSYEEQENRGRKEHWQDGIHKMKRESSRVPM